MENTEEHKRPDGTTAEKLIDAEVNINGEAEGSMEMNYPENNDDFSKGLAKEQDSISFGDDENWQNSGGRFNGTIGI